MPLASICLAGDPTPNATWSSGEASDIAGTQFSRPTVLVADDEKLIVDTIVEILEGTGFEVMGAYNGWAALDKDRPSPAGLCAFGCIDASDERGRTGDRHPKNASSDTGIALFRAGWHLGESARWPETRFRIRVDREADPSAQVNRAPQGVELARHAVCLSACPNFPHVYCSRLSR